MLNLEIGLGRRRLGRAGSYFGRLSCRCRNSQYEAAKTGQRSLSWCLVFLKVSMFGTLGHRRLVPVAFDSLASRRRLRSGGVPAPKPSRRAQFPLNCHFKTLSPTFPTYGPGVCQLLTFLAPFSISTFVAVKARLETKHLFFACPWAPPFFVPTALVMVAARISYSPQIVCLGAAGMCPLSILQSYVHHILPAGAGCKFAVFGKGHRAGLWTGFYEAR